MSTLVPITHSDERGATFHNYYMKWREAVISQCENEGRWFSRDDELAKIGATFMQGDMFNEPIYLAFKKDRDAVSFLMRWV